MALKCMADNNVNITCQEDARMYDYLAGGNSDYIIKNIGQELNINYSSTTLLVTLGSGEGVLQGRHISNSDSSSVKITLSQNATAYLVIRYDLSQPVGSEASFCSTSVLENDDLNNKGVKRDLLIGKYTTNSEGVTNFVDMRNYTLQNKKYLYETFARIPKIKRNLSVTPIVNDDVSTNKYYPYKYTVNFVGTKADDLASASLAIGVECEEFKGTNTVTDGVELLFSALPKENVLFSFVQVANEGTFSELTNNVEQIELNKRDITTNTQDITKLKNDINTLSNIKADGIICTTESKLINVKDSSNSAFNKLNVYGESSQITAKGYQLFDASKIPTKTQGGATVTNNGDGSFTVGGGGNTTGTFNVGYTIPHEQIVKLLKPGTLRVNSMANTFPYFQVKFSNSTGNRCLGNTGLLSTTITQNDIDDSASQITILFYGESNKPIIGTIIKPIVYQDGDGTWEPFTGGKPSPNPDNPQEIVNKTINEIKVTGKNLIGKNVKYITYGSGVGWILNRNAVVLPFKPTSETYGIGYTVMCEKGKSYTISVTNPNENAVVGITEYLSIEDMYSLTKKIGFAYPTPNKATYTAKTNGFLLCYIAGKWTNGSTTIHVCTDTELLQVEFGSTPTPYEPYKEQKVTLSLPITLCGLKSEQGNVTIDGQKYISDVITEKNGVYGVERNVTEKLFNGSENWILEPELNRFKTQQKDTLISEGKRLFVMCNRGVYAQSGAEVGAAFIGLEGYIYFTPNKDITSVSQFKMWVQEHHLTFLYKLATPTFEPLPIADQQALKQLHSFYPNTIITNNDNAFIKLNYVADTKMYIDNKIAEIVNQKVV